MSYTYQDFEKAMKNAGVQFSDADLELAKANPDAGMSLLQYKQDYAGAQNDMGRALAHAGAEGIRKQYGGYTGGADGSGYAVTGAGNGSFTSPANEQANAMLELLENREPFKYDPGTDPAAQTWRKAYAREGRRATEDTMGTAAALTGGMASSAATAAAAQAGNYYAAQGADKIAQLEQQAYSRYQNEGDQMRSQWSMYRDQADNEYNKWLSEQQLQAQKEAAEQERQQLEWQRQQQEYDRKYQLALLAAQYGDYSGLKELGVDTSNWTSGGGYSYGSGSSGGGSNGSASKTESDGLGDAAYNQILMSYPSGTIPASEWSALAAQYGESALVAAGFRKKSDATGNGNGNSTGEPRPTKPGDNRVNMMY